MFGPWQLNRPSQRPPTPEPRVTSAILCALYLLLSVGLIALLGAYLRYVRPSVENIPSWLAIGFPVALCMGTLHFGHRSFQAWRRFRRR